MRESAPNSCTASQRKRVTDKIPYDHRMGQSSLKCDVTMRAESFIVNASKGTVYLFVELIILISKSSYCILCFLAAVHDLISHASTL